MPKRFALPSQQLESKRLKEVCYFIPFPLQYYSRGAELDPKLDETRVPVCVNQFFLYQAIEVK